MFSGTRQLFYVSNILYGNMSTNISLATYANSEYPDQASHNAVSDHDFHCLLTECSIKI